MSTCQREAAWRFDAEDRLGTSALRQAKGDASRAEEPASAQANPSSDLFRTTGVPVANTGGERMIRAFFVSLVVAAALSLVIAPATLGAANPSGSGQPNQSCEDQPSGPAGFKSGGFEVAEAHYAGEGPGSTTHARSDHAVSQYDVACFQVSQH